MNNEYKIDLHKIGQAITIKEFEQKPRPTHKIMIPQGTILKAINSNMPDIIVSNDTIIEFTVEFEFYADHSNDHINCYSCENPISVLIKN